MVHRMMRLPLIMNVMLRIPIAKDRTSHRHVGNAAIRSQREIAKAVLLLRFYQDVYSYNQRYAV